MSKGSKRDVQQAFGTDHALDKTASPSKKKRRQRGKDSSQFATDAVQIVTPTFPTVDTPPESGKTLSRKSHSAAKQEPNQRDQPVDESGKTKQKERPQSPTITREEEHDAEHQSETLSSGTKKKSRSRRQSKPQFGQNNSQIELVLSRIKDHSDSANEVEIHDARHKSHSEEKRRRKGRDQPVEGQSKRKHKQRKSQTRSSRGPNDWSLTPPSGGASIDHDPVLTPDEQFLMLATKQDIHIYATKTSLLVRTLHVAKSSEVSTYALIQPYNQHIVIGLKDGTLLKYDWTVGRKLWGMSFNGSISSITSTSSNVEGDGFLMINESEDGSCNMTSLAIDAKGRPVGRRHLLSKKMLIKPQICFAAELGIVSVCSKDTILIGQLGSDNREDSAPFQWREVSVNGKIVCFDAQILPTTKQAKKGSIQPTVNIAVGLKSGEIYLYNDVLNNADASSDLHVRRLHWHRAAPRTVKFSADSNYLISGGDETVLVVWQLDTNQKQVLPHLTTAILNATISRQGSAYALRLADDSVMVLSTSDLRPFANISSLALDASSRAPYLSNFAIPAALHPNHSDRFLLAYSLQNSNSSIKPNDKSTNMLQTYDLASNVQLSRQALARNLVSTVNIGPSGQPLKEPDVTHLDITHDGKWLVTLDQWSPNETDTREMYLARADQSSRSQLNECFLRFWGTNNTTTDTGTDNWEMNTRIDEPVSALITRASSTKVAVLAIATSPVRHQVAVADSTRTLKLYSPKARIRSGVPVRDAQGQQLFTWTCDHMIPMTDASPSPDPKTAALAFSEDGSVLAVCWATDSHLRARAHLIECRSAKIAASLPGIVGSGTAQLAWCGRYLLGLSERFVVLDSVSMETVFAVEIEERFASGKSRLAVDGRNGVVAVSVSERDASRPSRLALFDVNAIEKGAVLEEQVTGQIHVLLARKGRGGFLIIDGEGRTRIVSPPGLSADGALTVTENVPEKVVVRRGLEDVFGDGRMKATSNADDDASAITRTGMQNARSQNLEDVFGFESTAGAPGAGELFWRVARVVAGAAA